MNDEELSFSGLLAAAARMEEVKNLISNPEHLAMITILFYSMSISAPRLLQWREGIW